jgi:glycosyltransferase involved in cell wall biosynthesis
VSVGVPPPSADLAPLRRTLFVLWGFPEVTETFIHREMMCLEGWGVPVHVLAGVPVRRTDELDPRLAAIVARARFLGPPARFVGRGLAWGARHPARYARVVARMTRLGHRDAWRRGRALAMTLAAASVADEVRRAGFTYLHAHFAHYHTELTMALAWLTGLPFGVTGHATGIWKDGNALADKLACARVFLTCTAYNAEHLRQLAHRPTDAAKVHRVHHGIDLSALPAPPPLPDGEVTHWLAVGRLIPKKGFDRLVDAVARLRQQGRRLSVTIYGEGPERERLQRRIRRHGLGREVRLGGVVPLGEVWQALGRSHALVMPSVRDRHGNIDGIPNVVLEAMAMARPVVGSALSGIPEVVHPGETGWLVPPGDPAALAEAMDRVGRDRARATRLGAAGRALVKREFDLERNTATQVRLLAAAARGEGA